MGFFSYLLGTDSKSPGARDIRKYRPIKRKQIHKIISSVKLRSLTEDKEKIVREEISNNLLSNETISLQVIRRVLSDLVKDKNISEIEKKHIYKAFENYFFNNTENT